MRIATFELPPIGTNAFLLTNEERREAILIDAPASAREAIAAHLEQQGLKLVAVLLTHGHFDHVLGAADFHADGVPLYAHPADQELLERLDQQMSFFGLPMQAESPRIDHWLAPGEPLNLLGRAIEVRHTPGHCPGNVTFVFPEEQVAFVGDAIFAGGIGRTDLPGGDFATLERAIREQIYTLPGDFTLYPGHGPATTVATERTSNPFVRVP